MLRAGSKEKRRFPLSRQQPQTTDSNPCLEPCNVSVRNVPFLLNGAPARPESVVDRILWKLAAYFRRKRFSGFHRLFSGVHTIIDFGGTPSIWLNIGLDQVVLLNIDEQQVPSGFVALKGDGRNTGLPSYSFDLAFSNSTIEHVGTWADQLAFARELCRVGKRVYCETPARSFFFEPHYFTAFVHWFPGMLKQYWFVRYFTYYGLKWKPRRNR